MFTTYCAHKRTPTRGPVPPWQLRDIRTRTVCAVATGRENLYEGINCTRGGDKIVITFPRCERLQFKCYVTFTGKPPTQLLRDLHTLNLEKPKCHQLLISRCVKARSDVTHRHMQSESARPICIYVCVCVCIYVGAWGVGANLDLEGGLVVLWWAWRGFSFHCDIENYRRRKRVICFPLQYCSTPASRWAYTSLFFSSRQHRKTEGRHTERERGGKKQQKEGKSEREAEAGFPCQYSFANYDASGQKSWIEMAKLTLKSPVLQEEKKNNNNFLCFYARSGTYLWR